MSISLIKSPVEFNEELHRYSLGDKRLMGITGLIHSILELGVYPDANEFVKNTAIPRAGQYGSAVHKAIELYDDLGIKQTSYPNTFGDEDWEVSRELESYIRHQSGFRPLANEYTVSDNFQYASQIDNVWVREETGGIWLADTKTNNLNYYPLDGYGLPNYFANHEDGLKEYLSWQLSVYAVLFERQNPGLKVEGLCANWLRKDEEAFWEIERKPDELVLELLKTVWYESFDGSIVYEHPDRSILHPQLTDKPKADNEAIIPEVGQLVKNGKTAEEVAARFGKSIRFVQDRIKLNALIPELMKEVKEDKMPISAAMIICKVSADKQRAYYKQYVDGPIGFTTASAQSFVKAMFLSVNDAVWKDSPEFADGCDKACAQCQYNTVNHGCLFYEMNAKVGQCTNPQHYQAKTVAFIEKFLTEHSDSFVKAGDPLEKGKTVIAINIDGYAPESVKKLKIAIRDRVKALGYEIVTPEMHFGSRCYYPYDDDRTQAMLESGECYRVLQLADYNIIHPQRQAWYLKKGDTETNVDGNGNPLKVQRLLDDYKHKTEDNPCRPQSRHLRATRRSQEMKTIEVNQDELTKFIVKNCPFIEGETCQRKVTKQTCDLHVFADELRCPLDCPRLNTKEVGCDKGRCPRTRAIINQLKAK